MCLYTPKIVFLAVRINGRIVSRSQTLSTNSICECHPFFVWESGSTRLSQTGMVLSTAVALNCTKKIERTGVSSFQFSQLGELLELASRFSGPTVRHCDIEKYLRMPSEIWTTSRTLNNVSICVTYMISWGVCRNLRISEVSTTTQAIGSAAHKCAVVSFHAAPSIHFCLHCTNFATNTCFVLYEWAWRPLRCTHGNQSFIFLDMPLWTY